MTTSEKPTDRILVVCQVAAPLDPDRKIDVDEEVPDVLQSLRLGYRSSDIVHPVGSRRRVLQADQGIASIIPIGQWSDPMTWGKMKASFKKGTRFFETKK